jgi:hypothetical protein
MQSRTGSWMIAAGTLIAFLGLCVLPASLGEKGDKNFLGAGAAIFSLGALAIASGIYLKASALQHNAGNKSSAENAKSNRPIRGGCDRCRVEIPIIQCKVHQQHLCGTCLSEHYDFRSCVYAPSTRWTAGGKSMAARAK